MSKGCEESFDNIMNLGAGHVIPRFYFYLTPVFILLDYLGVANIRVAILDSMPLQKNLYYGFCVVCGVAVFIRPVCSSVVGLLESSINVLMTVLVLYMPYIRFISETEDMLTREMPEVAGVQDPLIGNLIIAGSIAVISFRGCIYELTMGKDQP